MADEFSQALGLLAAVARPAEVPVGGKRSVREKNPRGSSCQNCLASTQKRKSRARLVASVAAG